MLDILDNKSADANAGAAPGATGDRNSAGEPAVARLSDLPADVHRSIQSKLTSTELDILSKTSKVIRAHTAALWKEVADRRLVCFRTIILRAVMQSADNSYLSVGGMLDDKDVMAAAETQHLRTLVVQIMASVALRECHTSAAAIRGDAHENERRYKVAGSLTWKNNIQATTMKLIYLYTSLPPRPSTGLAGAAYDAVKRCISDWGRLEATLEVASNSGLQALLEAAELLDKIHALVAAKRVGNELTALEAKKQCQAAAVMKQVIGSLHVCKYAWEVQRTCETLTSSLGQGVGVTQVGPAGGGHLDRPAGIWADGLLKIAEIARAEKNGSPPFCVEVTHRN